MARTSPGFDIDANANANTNGYSGDAMNDRAPRSLGELQSLGLGQGLYPCSHRRQCTEGGAFSQMCVVGVTATAKLTVHL